MVDVASTARRVRSKQRIIPSNAPSIGAAQGGVCQTVTVRGDEPDDTDSGLPSVAMAMLPLLAGAAYLLL